MLVRIITSIIGVAILIPIMWFSDTYVFPIAISVFLCVALYEMFSCIGFKNKTAATFPAYLIGGSMPFLCKLAGDMEKISMLICFVMFAYLVYLLFLSVIAHNKYDINEISLCLVLSIYIIGGFLSIQLLRNMKYGLYILILVFVAAWVTDIFAYFTGKFFGKHKLCVEISPKKTVEGSIGGTLICALSFLAVSFLVYQKENFSAAIVVMPIIGVILSVISQIGDLAMSLIKRRFGIKDFGNIFPGHGGILDRFDSIIAVAPAMLVIILTAKMVMLQFS